MKLDLLEKPSVYYRDDLAVVIFPSKPYWFSATKEIFDILEALKLNEYHKIIKEISEKLQTSCPEAKEILDDIIELLSPAGILSINGEINELPQHKPDFQVNEVENVLVIATTQKCNMACPMCYAMADKKMPNEMTTNEIKFVIDNLHEMSLNNGISRVALTGGELFTRPDAMELIDYVHSNGFFVQVNTNATLINANQIKELAKFPKLKMSISLDGCNAITHEAIRGKGTFERTVNNIRSLCKEGISVAINMFVHADNINEIEGTLLLAESLGVEGFNCLNMMNVGRGNTDEAKQLLNAVPLAKFYRKLFEIVRNKPNLQKLMMYSTFANQLMGIAGGVKSHTCGIGTNRAVYVKADGSLYPCADTALDDFCLGNLRSEKLIDVWENSSILKELRTLNIDTLNEKCSACDVRYSCAGNCRGENYQTTKDLRSPHFKCDEIHDSIIELFWILTEEPDLFKCKVDDIYKTINLHGLNA